MSQPYAKGGDRKKQALCKYFMRGNCTNPRCPYQHSKEAKSAAAVAVTNQQTGIMSTLLRLLFQKQQSNIYDSCTNTLNLTNLRACEDLKDVTTSINFNVMGFCDSLCGVIKETITTPPSILSIDDNNIQSPSHFFRAMEKHGIHVYVSAISARRNSIATTDFLQTLKGFSSLNEIALNDNPVVNIPDYRNIVKKALPQLAGLDMKSIDPMPLKLPWPVFPTDFDQGALAVLQFVEAFLHTDVNNAVEYYAAEATFSFVLSCQQAAFSNEKSAGEIAANATRSREVIKEVLSCQLRQKDMDHNIQKGVRSAALFRGRTMICGKLLEGLYHPSFAVSHELHPSPNIVMLGEGDSGVAIVSIHGKMTWTHRTCALVTITRNFSRTLQIVPNSGRWIIASDMLQLSPNSDDILLDCRCADRVSRASRKYGVDENVVKVVFGFCTNDWMVHQVLEDLKHCPMIVLEECAAVVGGDPTLGIAVARVATRRGLTAMESLSEFQSVSMDPSRVGELLPPQ